MFKYEMGMIQGPHLLCQYPKTLIGPSSLVGPWNPRKPFEGKILPMSTLF
jgi:hypothetical protein